MAECVLCRKFKQLYTQYEILQQLDFCFSSNTSDQPPNLVPLAFNQSDGLILKQNQYIWCIFFLFEKGTRL